MKAIYKIINKVTGVEYIGSSVNYKKRFGSHKSALRYNRHSNKILQNSWNLHGEENFEFVIFECLDELTQEELFEREQEIIDSCIREKKKIYNIEMIVHPTISELSRFRMSESWDREKHKFEMTDEIKDKIRKTLSGRKRPEEIAKKASASCRGKKWTDEQIQEYRRKRGWSLKSEEASKTKSLSKNSGTNNYNSKFTEEQIREIRALGATNLYMYKQIAEMYNVKIATIKRILGRKTYKEVV